MDYWGVEEVKCKIVADSFEGWVVARKWDGREYEKISSFKRKKACHNGKRLWHAQMK